MVDELVKFSNELGLNAISKTIEEMDELDSNFDFIVNASSLGLKNEKNIIPDEIVE